MKDWFMNIDEVQLITFSPTCTSKQVGEAIVHGTGISSVSKVDLTLEAAGKREVPSHALAVITVPVYGGHVAPLALERMKELHADGAPAVVVVVYGNRAYEDTLAELRDTASRAGFTVIAAVAAVAEHSIARQYAAGRPDAEDEAQLRTFAAQIRRKIDTGDQSEPEIPGNHPYRKAAGAGIVPKATRACVKCGLCAAKCPVGAIAPDDPTRVDKTRCISCMRCVAVCPHGTRHVNKLMLALVGRMLKKACSERKTCELYL